MASEFLSASRSGDLERVRYILAEGHANVTEKDDEGSTALLLAAENGHVITCVFLLNNGASIAEENTAGNTALLFACANDHLPTIHMLLAQYGAQTTEADHSGFDALLHAALCGSLRVCKWLIEYGGSDITATTHAGQTVWDLLGNSLVRLSHQANDAACVTAVLRVMLLHASPPGELAARLSLEHTLVVQEGARLRARLPVYLTQRRALLNEHCLLLPPLQALVCGYLEPTTTDQIWGTGLGAAPPSLHCPWRATLSAYSPY
jgi:hypothetical protein